MTRVSTLEEFEKGSPGTYFVIDAARGVMMKCPKCGLDSYLPIDAGFSPSWHVEQLESLTLSPSVHHVGCWHGWMRNGEWVQA